MGAIAIGMGVAGILMNIINIVIIFIGQHNKDASDSDVTTFMSTLIYYLINAVLNLMAASLYYIEKNNLLA